jgi:hypothetical protein
MMTCLGVWKKTASQTFKLNDRSGKLVNYVEGDLKAERITPD